MLQGGRNDSDRNTESVMNQLVTDTYWLSLEAVEVILTLFFVERCKANNETLTEDPVICAFQVHLVAVIIMKVM